MSKDSSSCDECVRARSWQGKVLILQKKAQAGHDILVGTMEEFPDFPVTREYDELRAAFDAAAEKLR